MLYGSYRRVDVKALLNDSKEFGKERRKLERQMESLLGLNSVNQEVCVKTSNISNTTNQVAMKRLEYQEKIDWIDEHRKALEIARGKLDKQENEVIDLFFFERGYKNALVDMYSIKYGVEKSTVYNINNKALKKLSEVLEELL